MNFIGPGRYREMTAIRSSMLSGSDCMMTRRMPADSNWNTPSVAPLVIISNTFGSSSGMFSTRKPGVCRPIICSAWSMTERLRRPRKSILRRPSSSIAVIVYCVTTASSFMLSGT